jgi:hypothetical protein
MLCLRDAPAKFLTYEESKFAIEAEKQEELEDEALEKLNNNKGNKVQKLKGQGHKPMIKDKSYWKKGGGGKRKH